MTFEQWKCDIIVFQKNKYVINVFNIIKNKMIKRLIEYLATKRKTEYIQYESSSKSNSARNYINYSTLKTISIKISTLSFASMFQ